MKRVKLSQTKWSNYLRGDAEVTPELLQAFERYAQKIGEARAIQVAQYALDKGLLRAEPLDYEEGADGVRKLFSNDASLKRMAGNLGVAVEALGGDEFAELLELSGVGNNPAVVAELASVGGEIALGNVDDHIRTTGLDQEKRSESQAKAATSGMTPEQARKELSEMKTNKDHPWHERWMRGESDAVDYTQRLIDIIDGQSADSGVPNAPAAPNPAQSIDAQTSWNAKQAAILGQPLGALSGTDYPREIGKESASKVLFSVPDDDETEVD